MQKLYAGGLLDKILTLHLSEEGFVALDEDLGHLVGKLKAEVLHVGLKCYLKLLILLQGGLLRVELTVGVCLFVIDTQDAEGAVSFVSLDLRLGVDN